MSAASFFIFDAIIFHSKETNKKNFGKLVEGLSIPNLIEVQKIHTMNFLSQNHWKIN